MAIESFSDLITQTDSTLQNFSVRVGQDVTSANGAGATDFSKAMGTFIGSPSSPWTSGTIPLNVTGAVRGGTCAIWYKGPVLSYTDFTGGSVVMFSGSNTLNELCLVLIMLDKVGGAFTVNIQTGATGVVPSANASQPLITVTDPTLGASEPVITVT